MAMTQEKFEKLPKWAQQEFETVNRKAEDLQRMIDGFTNVEPTGVSADQGVFKHEGQQHIVAPYGVEFALNDKEVVNVKVMGEQGQKYLRIMATGHPTQLVVIPQVTNVVNVEFRK